MGNDSPPRCGFVAVMGAPNAGKSTLINSLVGTKVTIVSDKVQTTRTLVRGIALHKQSQVVFIDTPGVFAAKKRLERAMVAAAWQGGEEADMILLVIDASRKKIPDQETARILDRLKNYKTPCILVLNKIDQIRREALLDIARTMSQIHDFAAVFMVSALKDNGVKDILDFIASRLPETPWVFPEDDVSDMPMRLMAAEITREKFFKDLYRELPHSLAVETEEWEIFDDGSIKISQVVFVERESQRKIVLGKEGDTIRKAGESARRELESILETRVHLKLFVKVRGDWSEDPERYAPWGLDFSA